MGIIRPAARLVILILLCASIIHSQTPCQTSAPHVSEKDIATSQPTNPSIVNSTNPQEKNLLLIADNQEHVLTGVQLKLMGLLSELFATSVAMRPPLAHVGGRLLLREALLFGKQNKADLVLHLGDAANISCEHELTSVFDALDKDAKDIWFMAPGNHDGMLVGTVTGSQPSLNYKISDDDSTNQAYVNKPSKGHGGLKRGWPSACLSPERLQKALETDKENPGIVYNTDLLRKGILTRGDAINLYLDRLKSRDGFLPTSLEPEYTDFGDTRVTCDVKKVEIKPLGYAAIASICQPTPVKDKPNNWVGPFASYIVQRLEVGGATILLLDTSDYDNPSLFNVALKGGLTHNQKRHADYLLFGKGPKDSFGFIKRNEVIVVGHHPLDDFPQKDQRWIVERTSRYISAHVHRSTQLISHKLSERRRAVELNIGSTLDYPPQAVIAKLAAPASMSFRVFGEKTSDAGFLQVCKDKEKEDEWKLDSKFYKGYRRGTYVNRLLAALEAANVRHTAKLGPSIPQLTIPTGKKDGDWQLLENALRDINRTEREDSRTFWACQAYYASKENEGEHSLFELGKELLRLGTKSGCDATKGWFSFSPP